MSFLKNFMTPSQRQKFWSTINSQCRVIRKEIYEQPIHDLTSFRIWIHNSLDNDNKTKRINCTNVIHVYMIMYCIKPFVPTPFITFHVFQTSFDTHFPKWSVQSSIVDSLLPKNKFKVIKLVTNQQFFWYISLWLSTHKKHLFKSGSTTPQNS